MVFDVILMGRQSSQKLQCLYGNLMANNFFPKLNFTQFVNRNVKILDRRCYYPTVADTVQITVQTYSDIVQLFVQ